MSKASVKLPHVSYYQRARGGRWVIAYSVSGLPRRTEMGGLDEASTIRKAREISEKLELFKSGQIDRAAVVGWSAERKPLARHIEDWRQTLRVGNTPGHVASHMQKVADLLAASGIQAITQVTAPKVRAALERMRLAGTSLQTLNHYIQAVTQFTRWAAHPEQGRLQADPLDRRLSRYNARTDRRHQRRALTVEEVAKIITAAEHSTARRKVEMQPADRGLLYRVAVETGLRAGELRALKIGAFKLGKKPRVEYRAEDDKAGRGGSIPLRTGLASMLASAWVGRANSDLAFPLMPEKPIKMWRRDLARAGVPYETAEGYGDFHCLRHTCGSWLLAAGVPIKTVQSIMRHSDINLTMDRYGHSFQENERAAVEAFSRGETK